MQKGIKKAYSNCNKDNDDEDQNKKEDDMSDFKGNGSSAVIDPSGYVYEAVLSNRLEGVTAI